MVSATTTLGVRTEEPDTLAVAQGRMDPFRCLGQEERRSQLEAYRAFLVERDGDLDLRGRTLSKREAYFRDIDALRVVTAGDADLDGFYQRLHGVGTPEVSAKTLWMLVVAKANQMESYGVEGELAKWFRRGVEGVDEIVLYDLLEEQYHSRILAEVCETAGLGGVRFTPPGRLTRSLIHVMQHFPDDLRYVAVTCGEILGCIVFRSLHERTDHFADEPEVQSRLRSLLSEILLDETGHVVYCRARMSPLGLRCADWLMPCVTRFLLRDVPELASLGFDPTELTRQARSGLSIPRQFDWLPGDPRRI